MFGSGSGSPGPPYASAARLSTPGAKDAAKDELISPNSVSLTELTRPVMKPTLQTSIVVGDIVAHLREVRGRLRDRDLGPHTTAKRCVA